MMYEQNGSINKETENLKRNNKEILKLKSIITETKNSLEFTNRIHQGDLPLSRKIMEWVNQKIHNEIIKSNNEQKGKNKD